MSQALISTCQSRLSPVFLEEEGVLYYKEDTRYLLQQLEPIYELEGEIKMHVFAFLSL